MFPIIRVGRHLRHRGSWRASSGWRALAVPVLVPAVVAFTAVQSVTLSPSDLTSGGTATATVTLDANPVVLTRVQLSSSNTSVATVPPLIDLGGRLGSRGTFPVNTVAGSGGCSTISARVGTTAPQSALLFVEPPSSTGPLALTLSTKAVMGGLGTPLSGTVTFSQSDTARRTVLLSSNNPAVTVPASVDVYQPPAPGGPALYSRSASFTINVASVPANTCAVVTATSGTSQSRALLKVFKIVG